MKALINEQPYEVLIDTGAEISVIDSETARKVGAKDTGEKVEITTVVGRQKLPLLEALRVRIGNQESKLPFVLTPLRLPRPLISARAFDKQRRRNKCVRWIAANQMSSQQYETLQQEKYKEQPEIKPEGEDNYTKQKQCFKKATTHLHVKERKVLWALLEEFRDVWEHPKTAQVNYEAKFVYHGKPFRAKLGHMNEVDKEELIKQVKQQLKLGVIRPSKSEHAAKPHFVPKKTGERRWLLDYRPLNASMVPDSYPLPLIWDNLRAVAGHQYYITLDMNAGFWNVPIEEGCKHLTAFITPIGLYEFNVIPFGIRNSPAEFQRAMDMAFAPVLGDNVYCYIDDIVLCADDLNELFVTLRKVLNLCRSSGFYLRLDKSEWVKKEVDYLGHVVGKNGIKVQKKKETLLGAPRPDSKKSLRSFLGMAGYLRGYIPRYSDYTAHMFDLLKKDTQFAWNEDHERDFIMLKKAVAHTTTLQPIRAELPFLIYTDASELGIGAALMQVEEDGREVPIEYASYKFRNAETRWDTRETELFAVKWAIDRWR